MSLINYNDFKKLDKKEKEKYFYEITEKVTYLEKTLNSIVSKEVEEMSLKVQELINNPPIEYKKYI